MRLRRSAFAVRGPGGGSSAEGHVLGGSPKGEAPAPDVGLAVPSQGLCCALGSRDPTCRTGNTIAQARLKWALLPGF